MRNLFLHPETWRTLRNIDISPESSWTFNVEGNYSSDENSRAEHWELEPGDVLRGAVSYAVHRADSWSDTDLFFLVMRTDSWDVVFSHRLLAYGEESSSGSFELDIDAYDTSGLVLGVSHSDSSIGTPYGYSGLGSLTIEPPPPPPLPPPPRPRGHVFELDRGWSFDGMYIPHFLELNWYFGEDPFTYKGIQKVRVHGLSKGYVKLDITVNGMQTDYTEDYSKNPQKLDLLSMPIPELEGYVSEDFNSSTAYADVANRGISVQMKFNGRNKICNLPEPSHVLQVLAIQQAPSGARAN